MTDRVVGDDEPRRPRGPERSTSPDGADGPTIAARGWPRWRRGCGWTLVAGGLLVGSAEGLGLDDALRGQPVQQHDVGIGHGVPAWMASIHQVVGMITLALAVSIYHQTRAVSP